MECVCCFWPRFPEGLSVKRMRKLEVIWSVFLNTQKRKCELLILFMYALTCIAKWIRSDKCKSTMRCWSWWMCCPPAGQRRICSSFISRCLSAWDGEDEQGQHHQWPYHVLSPGCSCQRHQCVSGCYAGENHTMFSPQAHI